MNSSDSINMVLDYVEQNLCKELDKKIIASISACSFSQFERIFSFIVGISLSEYIRKRKLSLAAISLKHSKQNIIDIAISYGYDTASGFTRAFKSHHGATPTEIINEEKKPVLFNRIFFSSPLYTGIQNYRVDKGEMKMAKLTYIDFKSFGAYKVIGCAIDTKLMSNDIPMLWGRFFSDGSFDTLVKLCEKRENLTALPDAYTGLMCNFKEDGTITYLVGLIFPETVETPIGFDEFKIPKGTIAEAHITGEEYEIYSQGHELVINAIENAGHKVAWDNFYQCEVYTDERFEKAKKAGNSIVTLDYYIPIL